MYVKMYIRIYFINYYRDFELLIKEKKCTDFYRKLLLNLKICAFLVGNKQVN